MGAGALTGIFSLSFSQTQARGGAADADLITALTLGDLPGLNKLLAAGADPNAFNPMFKGPIWLSRQSAACANSTVSYSTSLCSLLPFLFG
jgi:hypothetical protein